MTRTCRLIRRVAPHQLPDPKCRYYGRMSAKEMIVVFSGDDLQAQMVWSRLEGHGIEAQLIDSHMGGIAPWYVTAGGVGAVKVAVATKDVDKARDVLDGDEN